MYRDKKIHSTAVIFIFMSVRELLSVAAAVLAGVGAAFEHDSTQAAPAGRPVHHAMTHGAAS